MHHVCALALAAAIAFPAAAAGRRQTALHLAPGLGRPDAVWVFGRVVEEERGKRGRGSAAQAAVGRADAEVEVSFLGRTALATSGANGEFEVVIRPARHEAFTPGPHEASVRVDDVAATTRIQVVDPGAPYVLVSGFGDTVAAAHTAAPGARSASALRDTEARIAIPGMAAFFQCLAARDAPVVFVSGAPLQLAPGMAHFLEKNGFPRAVLYLRNLGREAVSSYKEPVLEELAERFPGVSFVLVGNTADRDPELFAAFTTAYPGRVSRVYLRQAARDPIQPSRSAGALVFQDAAEAARDAAGRWLANDACVAGAFPEAPLTPPSPPGGAGGEGG